MERTIRVIGKGKLSVKPDTIRLIMTVEGVSEEYDQAVKESADMTNMLKDQYDVCEYRKKTLIKSLKL